MKNFLNKLSILLVLLFIGCAGQISQIEKLTVNKERVRSNPNDLEAHRNLAQAYGYLGRNKERIKEYEEVIRIDPNDADAHSMLAFTYEHLKKYEKAIKSWKELIRLRPGKTIAHIRLGYAYGKLGRKEESIVSYKKASKLYPDYNFISEKINEAEGKMDQKRASPSVRQTTPQPSVEQSPQSGTGSGFFVSKLGHVITNAHVVQNCNKVTIGDNANKQVPAEVINTDRSNDLALLKLSTLEMASAESKSLIQKLSIAVVPLTSKGLLRSDDVRLGEKVLVAGYPFGDTFSNTIKVTTGVVSATRGAGDNSGQFQLDAAVQPGNSGGPIYDSGGNIVGVVISQLNKKTFGGLVENVNFGIKASTVRQFLVSSGINSKKAEQTEEKSTEQLAEIAKNQALMVMCLQ
jgi:S1-C subfamily serine protease